MLSLGVTEQEFVEALRERAREGDMSMVLESYEKEVSKPI